MQINVITQSVGVEETLGSCTAEQPIDADITLPDYCPDIRRVLKCLVTPRITAVQTAGDRATADGSAGVCVIYADEQGTVCCFEQTYPFSKYADLKGADENCCVNVRAYTQYANCRAVSPRRIDIHAVVSVAFGISGVKEEEIITGAEGAGIQLRCCDSRTASLVACTETAFPMSETVPLPGGGARAGDKSHQQQTARQGRTHRQRGLSRRGRRNIQLRPFHADKPDNKSRGH